MKQARAACCLRHVSKELCSTAKAVHTACSQGRVTYWLAVGLDAYELMWRHKVGMNASQPIRSSSGESYGESGARRWIEGMACSRVSAAFDAPT
eukprot:6191288-Pleurochrysis_carterae.AAC.3